MSVPEPIRRTYGELAVEVHADAHRMGLAAARRAAATVREAIAARGSARVILATGTSQLPFFEALRQEPDVAWDRVTAFHMDEYIGIDADHPASFRDFLHTHVVDPLGVGAFHGIDGAPNVVEGTIVRYRALLEEAPIDLCCMGIGENGHLAFNDPSDADFADPEPIRIVELDEVSRRQQVGEGHFPDLDAVPRRAITLTVPRLLDAAHVQVVVPEARKAPAVAAALQGPISPSCPASILRRVPHAVLYLDRSAAGELDASTAP